MLSSKFMSSVHSKASIYSPLSAQNLADTHGSLLTKWNWISRGQSLHKAPSRISVLHQLLDKLSSLLCPCFLELWWETHFFPFPGVFKLNMPKTLNSWEKFSLIFKFFDFFIFRAPSYKRSFVLVGRQVPVKRCKVLDKQSYLESIGALLVPRGRVPPKLLN